MLKVIQLLSERTENWIKLPESQGHAHNYRVYSLVITSSFHPWKNSYFNIMNCLWNILIRFAGILLMFSRCRYVIFFSFFNVFLFCTFVHICYSFSFFFSIFVRFYQCLTCIKELGSFPYFYVSRQIKKHLTFKRLRKPNIKLFESETFSWS